MLIFFHFLVTKLYSVRPELKRFQFSAVSSYKYCKSLNRRVGRRIRITDFLHTCVSSWLVSCPLHQLSHPPCPFLYMCTTTSKAFLKANLQYVLLVQIFCVSEHFFYPSLPDFVIFAHHYEIHVLYSRLLLHIVFNNAIVLLGAIRKMSGLWFQIGLFTLALIFVNYHLPCLALGKKMYFDIFPPEFFTKTQAYRWPMDPLFINYFFMHV